MYEVEISSTAREFVRIQTKKLQRQLLNKMRLLAKDPRPQNAKKLKGYEELYRIRSGNYRIVYHIRDKKLMVLVVAIGHRSSVYDYFGRGT